MALYAVIDVTVKDQEKLKEYVAGHLPTIVQYGGKILGRGFDPEVVTGNWAPRLLVIHEWPSREQFQSWYDSAEYRPWKKLREEACEMNMVLLGGAL
jgi:uncharacterized protein (DUF1330 family)